MLPPSHTCLSPAPCIYVAFSSLLETRPLDHAHTLSPHFKLIPIAHTLLVSLSHMHSIILHSPSLSHAHGLFATTRKMPMPCTEHQDAFVWVVYLVGKRMNEGMPYLQMWRGVWVSFCKIVIVSFLSVRYRSDGLYCRMAGTRSLPTMLFIRVGIKIELVMMVGLPSCNVGCPIYIWQIGRKIWQFTHTLHHICR